MNQADVVALLKHMNADLTRTKAQLASVTEAVAGWTLPGTVGGRPSPAKLCVGCGEKLGYGHLEDCPRLP